MRTLTWSYAEKAGKIAAVFATPLAFSLLLAACVAAPASTSPTPPTPTQSASPSLPAESAPWLVEDFETPGGKSGGFWCAFDHNGLGTKVSPDPFELATTGAPPSPGHSARYFGTIGENRPPYSWAQLQVFVAAGKAPKDLRGFRSLRFWAKGDGGRYAVALTKQAVTDYDNFRAEFSVGSEWSEVQVPFERFVQQGWGKKQPAVFDDVVQIQFSPATFGGTFELSVDNIVLSPEPVVEKPLAYDTHGWFEYRGTDPIKRRGTALDVSRLLQAPAGKLGPVKRQGENFVLAGKPMRFWGVNVVASANFPTHDEADRLAELLAQMGVNMTRHHHLDAAWSTPNIFGNAPSTLKLDPAQLERFDYFVAALQKRGIYQFFDMIVSRHGEAADGVPAPSDVVGGFKIEGEFSPKLIELQEQFIEQLMGHQNPYTKRTYAKDPAVALIDVINEDSLFWLQREGEFAINTPEYRGQLSRLFSDWLTKLVPGGRSALEQRWKPDAAGGQGLGPNEDPSQHNVDAVVMFASDDPKRLSRARAKDTLRFYYDTTLGYYRRIQSKLQHLGYAGLVTGSNHWVESVTELHANAQLDFVDRHAYWSHPQGGWGYDTKISWGPGSMLKDNALGVVGSLGARRVKGLPYTASEWQTSAPNDYRNEGVLAMGAYAALINMSPLEFAFSHDQAKHPESIGRLTSNFDLIEQPTMLAAWPAVSLLFHRHDVAEAKQEAVLRVDEQQVFDPLFRGGAPGELTRLGKTGIGFGQGQSAAQLRDLAQKQIQDGVAKANGGELVHDAKHGTLLVNTPRTQAFAGFKPSEPVALQNVLLKLDSGFAVVIVSALDDQPLATSKHLLVTALGNAVNKGMSLTASGNRLQDPGSSPVLVEPILGRLELRALAAPSKAGAAGHAKVYALGQSGERDHVVQSEEGAGTLAIGLSAEHHTMHYEIVRE